MKIIDLFENSPIARLDLEVMLACLLKQDRTWLIAHQDYDFAGKQQKKIEQWILRRKKGEPVAYIVQEKEFYGRPFFVSDNVLIPRPATEGLIDQVLSFLENPKDEVRVIDSGIVCFSRVLSPGKSPDLVVDVGTGSGCIAVTLALERPNLILIATDDDSKVFSAARKNARRFGVSNRITFKEGNLLDPVKNSTENFLLVANLPYVPDDAPISPDVKHEPEQAVFGGKNGTDILKELLKQAKNNPFCNGFCIECRADQIFIGEKGLI